MNITVIVTAFVLKRCKKSKNRSAAKGQLASFSPNLGVVTLNSSLGENFTHGNLLRGVQNYVQGQNIKYIDSLSVIRIVRIGICTLVQLYLML